jgi:hypothetical protein
MRIFLRTRLLAAAAALLLTATAAADIFGQSSGMTADVTNSAAPKNIASSNSTSRKAATTKSPSTVGNFPVIVPSKLNDGAKTNEETDKATPKATDKVANKSGAEDSSASGDSAAPPSPAPPSPQGGVSQLSGRTISRDRLGPQQYNATAIKMVDHVNAVVGGFDQGAGFGFGMEFTTAKGADLKGFEFYARALGSTKLYRAGELGARVGTNKTRGEFWFNYTRRTRDNFFDFGSLIPEDPETNFSTERRSYNGLFSHRFLRRVEGGLYGSFSSTGSFRGEDDRDLPIDTIFSGNPGVTPITSFLPGFQQNVRLVSYGTFAEVDLRNNERGLTRGGYFYGRFGSVDAVDSDNTFSDFGWNETELDGRVYIPVFSHKTSIALRGYAVLRDPKGGSQVPFYEQAFFGGRSVGRGFTNARFRGNNSVLYSGEVRQTIWSQNDENTKGLDIIVFGDVGQVWGDNRSNTNPIVLRNDDFDSRNYRTGAGGGIQYRLNKSVAFRFEIGASNERTLGYISLRPGF